MSEVSGNDCPLLPPSVSQSLTLVAQPPKEPPTPPPPVPPLCNENVNHHSSMIGVSLASTNGARNSVPQSQAHPPPLPMPLPPSQIPPPPPYTPPHLSQVPPPPPTTPPSANTSPKSTDTKNVCRDFLRGVCYRGASCKYLHSILKDSVKFCHDFQNKGCVRPNCTYIHCTNAEEQHFMKTNKISPSILEKYFKNPICKDYAAGHCDKGKDCPFRHYKEEEKPATPNNILARPPPPTPLPVHHTSMPRGVPRGPPPPPRPLGEHNMFPGAPGPGRFSNSPRLYPPNITMPPPCPPNWRNTWIPPKQIKEEKEDWSTPPPVPRAESVPNPQKRLWNGNEDNETSFPVLAGCEQSVAYIVRISVR